MMRVFTGDFGWYFSAAQAFFFDVGSFLGGRRFFLNGRKILVRVVFAIGGERDLSFY